LHENESPGTILHLLPVMISFVHFFLTVPAPQQRRDARMQQTEQKRIRIVEVSDLEVRG
jgi:hypothetical protein